MENNKPLPDHTTDLDQIITTADIKAMYPEIKHATLYRKLSRVPRRRLSTGTLIYHKSDVTAYLGDPKRCLQTAS